MFMQITNETRTEGLRSLSNDAADVLIEMDGVFDRVSTRQSVQVIRVEQVLVVSLRLGWPARWRTRRARVKHRVEIVTRPSLPDRCAACLVAPTYRWQPIRRRWEYCVSKNMPLAIC